MPKKILDCTTVTLVEQETPGGITKEWIVELALNNYTEGLQRGRAEALAYLKGSLGDNNAIYLNMVGHFSQSKGDECQN